VPNVWLDCKKTRQAAWVLFQLIDQSASIPLCAAELVAHAAFRCVQGPCTPAHHTSCPVCVARVVAVPGWCQTNMIKKKERQEQLKRLYR
jgi:hypothetical protein